MLRHPLAVLLMASLLLLSASHLIADDEAPPPQANDIVLAHVQALKPGGGYKWKGSGVPHDLWHAGVRILPQSPSGTYCSGVTFTVALSAATDLGLLQDKTAKQVKQFQRHWYGTDDASTETQSTHAMEQLGVGHAVPIPDAKPGDFVQFWRSKSGHSVVFLGWVHDENNHPIGIRYWSSQSTTDGIGERTEFFAGIKSPDGKEGSVNPQRLYVCRLNERTP